MAKNFITIKEDSYDEFVEKKSTFITHLIRINSEEEARDFIQKMRRNTTMRLMFVLVML